MNESSANRIFFLLKDPYWAFVWWELSPAATKKVGKDAGTEADQIKMCLRIHDVTHILFDGSNSHWYFDIDVNGLTGHWYLILPTPNRVYCIEVGFRTPEQQFFSAARSNSIFVPRVYPSGSADENWSSIDL